MDLIGIKSGSNNEPNIIIFNSKILLELINY